MSVAGLVTASLAWLWMAAGEIYEATDDQGNRVYTDIQPHDSARPAELPGLTVAKTPARPDAAAETAGLAPAPLELRLTAPRPEEHIQGTGNALTVLLETTGEVPDDALTIIYLNGQAMERVTGMRARLEAIDRGEHRLRAELQTADGQILAATDEIVFHMRQASRLHPGN